MSSMEDCSEYGNPHGHHSQQQQQQHLRHAQHQQSKLSAALSSTALSHHQAQSQMLQAAATSGQTTLTRGSRRSSYGHNHYQQQLVPQAIVNFHDGLTAADNISVGSGSIISNHSGQRYVPDLQQYGTLTSHHRGHNADRYALIEDSSSSCLQPPSPAPSNDHYVMGMPSPSPSVTGVGPSSHHHHYPMVPEQRHYATLQQRTMSPSNSR